MLEIRTQNGSTIKATGAALKMLDIGLDEMTAPLKVVLEKNLREIEKQAARDWPYDFRRKQYNELKPHSRDQFRIETKRVIEGGNIKLESSLHNDAEYAYMIKTSTKFESQTENGRAVNLPEGTHVFSRLLWYPMQRAALSVARQTANIYVTLLKRAS
jgi:hypothetical protein